MSEQEHDAEFRELLEAAHRLPKRIDPPRDLWAGIEAGINRPRVAWWWLAAAAGVVLLLVARTLLTPAREGGPASWPVARVAGAPRVGETPLARVGALRVGDWLETDDSSRALIQVGRIGQVAVKPGTRIRLVAASSSEHRLALARGAIDAKVEAPPRLFFVETPAGVAVDLGCAYTLEMDSLGSGLLHVTGGYVEFAWGGRRSIVPLGAYAVTRPGKGPGIPYAEDAPAALRLALADFDFAGEGTPAVRRALAAARPDDALSLWHLLARVDEPLRGAVYDRLASLVAPPPGVARDAALRLDAAALERYWNAIRRIQFRKVILRGIRDIDARTGLAK